MMMEQIGAPALYANIPIINIKNDMKAEKVKEFDGVNFAKKLEEVKKEEAKKEKVEKTIVEMIDGIKPDEKEESNIKAQDAHEEDEENEEDDDVTFDDLLKAAEEEDSKKVSEG